MSERGDIRGLYAPISIATCWYVAYEKERVDPQGLFQLLADVMDAVPMGRSVLLQALQSPGTRDFEDAYLAAAGATAGASAVVTRNEADFSETDLTPLSSDGFNPDAGGVGGANGIERQAATVVL